MVGFLQQILSSNCMVGFYTRVVAKVLKTESKSRRTRSKGLEPLQLVFLDLNSVFKTLSTRQAPQCEGVKTSCYLYITIVYHKHEEAHASSPGFKISYTKETWS